jgi:hypothetical protein
MAAAEEQQAAIVHADEQKEDGHGAGQHCFMHAFLVAC